MLEAARKPIFFIIYRLNAEMFGSNPTAAAAYLER